MPIGAETAPKKDSLWPFIEIFKSGEKILIRNQKVNG
jgi:hypothetical protein